MGRPFSFLQLCFTGRCSECRFISNGLQRRGYLSDAWRFFRASLYKRQPYSSAFLPLGCRVRLFGAVMSLSRSSVCHGGQLRTWQSSFNIRLTCLGSPNGLFPESRPILPTCLSSHTELTVPSQWSLRSLSATSMTPGGCRMTSSRTWYRYVKPAVSIDSGILAFTTLTWDSTPPVAVQHSAPCLTIARAMILQSRLDQDALTRDTKERHQTAIRCLCWCSAL